MAKPRKIDAAIILTLVGGAIYLFLYYITHYFQLPKPFLGVEIKTTAIIFNAPLLPNTGYQFQSIQYMYQIDGVWYTGAGKLGRQEGAVSLGDEIPIVYDSWISSNSRMYDSIVGKGYHRIEDYFTKTSSGFEKLQISEVLIILKKYSSNKSLLSLETGLISHMSYSLIVFDWCDVNLLEKGDYRFGRVGQIKDSLKIVDFGYENVKTGLTYK